jgi:hypothetical protein
MVAHTQSIHILDPCPEESLRSGVPVRRWRYRRQSHPTLENHKYHADAFLRAQSPRQGMG